MLTADRGAANKLWERIEDQGDGWRSGQFEVENPAQVHRCECYKTRLLDKYM